MLWSELQDRVLIGLDPTKKTLFKTRALKYLYDAEEDFVLNTDCLEYNFTAILSAKEYSMALPETFLDVQRVTFEGKKLFYMPLWTETALKDTNDTWIQGTPTHYLIQGRELFVYPGAKVGGTLSLWCQGIFSTSPIPKFEALNVNDYTWESWADKTVFEDLQHGPSIPFEYHKYLVDYSRSLLHEDEGDDGRADRLMNKYVGNRAKIKQIYARQKNPVVGKVMDVIDGQVAQ